MSVVLEGITTKIILETEDKISRAIHALQNSFHLKEIQITPQQLTDIISSLQRLYLCVQQAPLLGFKLEAHRKFQEYISQVKNQYSELLPQSLAQDIIALELQSQASNDLIKAQSFILTAFLNSHNEVNSFKSFYEGLKYLQAFVEKAGNYLSSDAKKLLQITLENIIYSDFFQKNDFDYLAINQENKEEIQNDLKSITNLTKAILWDVSKLQPHTPVEQFDSIDELWSHWENTYKTEEVEASLELFEKAIDEERRQRNGRTLFS